MKNMMIALCMLTISYAANAHTTQLLDSESKQVLIYPISMAATTASQFGKKSNLFQATLGLAIF